MPLNGLITGNMAAYVNLGQSAGDRANQEYDAMARQGVIPPTPFERIYTLGAQSPDPLADLLGFSGEIMKPFDFNQSGTLDLAEFTQSRMGLWAGGELTMTISPEILLQKFQTPQMTEQFRQDQSEMYFSVLDLNRDNQLDPGECATWMAYQDSPTFWGIKQGLNLGFSPEQFLPNTFEFDGNITALSREDARKRIEDAPFTVRSILKFVQQSLGLASPVNEQNYFI